jgi:16S rRNA (guanine527-N7)-methyltransferase
MIPEKQAMTELTLGGWIEEISRRLNLQITEAMVGQLLEYFQMLREWNKKINLTTVLDDEGIAVKHLLDSLMLLPYLGQVPASGHPGEVLSLIDVGSGAGFPGLPLKIIRPDLRVVLVDAMGKRVRFLEEVIATLGLRGAAVVHDRAENTGRSADFRETFDVATARAVASLPVLCEYCLPFVRTGGIFLAMKGTADVENFKSMRAIQMLGGEPIGIETFNLPGTDIKRTIIQIRKISPTPTAYPRRAGLPEARPLV